MFAALMKKEILSLLRDVHGMVALFLMPMVFIVVMSTALQDVYSPARAVGYAIDQADRGAAATTLVARWTAAAGTPRPLPADWRGALRAGRLQYVLRVDPGFSAAFADPVAGGAVRLHLLADPALNQALFDAERSRLLALVGQMRAEDLLRRLNLGVDIAAAVDAMPLSAERLSSGARPTAVQQNVPAWLVFGMFFVVASIAGLFVEERACGALARLRSLGASPAQLIVGKAAPYLLVNAVQAALMLGVGAWLMPRIGGDGLLLTGVDWPALLLMLGAVSVAAVGLALAVACVVRTQAQAAAVGPMLNILMAALGGIMVPTFVMPAAMQRLAAWSPMNWGLEGMLDVLVRHAGVVAVLPEAARLGAFGGVMAAVGFVLFRRRV